MGEAILFGCMQTKAQPPHSRLISNLDINHLESILHVTKLAKHGIQIV